MRYSSASLLLVPACLALLTGASEARQLTGTTKSTVQNLEVVVTSTDGAQYTSAVTVTKTKQYNGTTIYLGKYSLDVPVGKNVMVQYATVNKDGSFNYLTAADFSVSAAKSGSHTWHFVMGNPPAGGSPTVNLGAIKVGRTFGIPVFNPLTAVDEDGNGVDDYDDGNQCDEDDQGDQDTDQDGNGTPDDEDDQGEDGGGDTQ